MMRSRASASDEDVQTFGDGLEAGERVVAEEVAVDLQREGRIRLEPAAGHVVEIMRAAPPRMGAREEQGPRDPGSHAPGQALEGEEIQALVEASVRTRVH